MKCCSLAVLRTIAGVCVFVGVCVTITALSLTLGQPPKTGGTSHTPSQQTPATGGTIQMPTTDSQPVFSTGGDMLDYLKSIGQISAKDGLLVTWHHAANNKSQMQEALNSGIMVLEADVNVQGHGTVNETNIPIMAHPPAVYSDNTLEEWLDSVLLSSKGIKLDFKSIQAVSPSLDLLMNKSAQVNINRPVWINADIVPGPNVNNELGVNATQFLSLIQGKYPNITISPGWVTLYLPPIISNRTYTRAMIERMYDLVKDLPQRITFPARAVLTRSAWPHFDWLLQQSDRYTLTLWQGSEDPLTLDDLLFIRDNSDPEQIYYDIYDPLLSEFKQIVLNTNRKKLFYSGGSLRMYFHPEDSDGLLVKWSDAEGDMAAVRSLLQSSFGMLTIQIDVRLVSSTLRPVVAQSSSTLLLEDCLKLVAGAANPWGVYLQPKDHASLNETLHLLNRLNSEKLLYFPVWISMGLSYGSFSTPGYVKGEDFINSINDIFPAVTIAPRWPPEKLDNGYTDLMVQDMLKLFEGVWQDVSFQLQAVALGKAWLSTVRLLKASATYTLTVEHTKDQGTFMEGYHGLMAIRTHTSNGVYYKLPPDYRTSLMTNIYST